MKLQKSYQQREKEKQMIRNVWRSWLYGSPVLIGFFALAISISLGTFIMGFAGVIVIINKEMTSGWGTIRGPIAIITGGLMTTICWGSAIFFLLN